MSTADTIAAAARATLDALDADLATARADLATASTDRDEWRTTAEGLTEQLHDAQTDAATAQGQVSTLTATVTEQAATITALRAQIAALTKPATLWGACPTNPGGTGSTAIQSVLTKWGQGVALRLFTASGLDVLPTIPDGIALVHMSWKPDLAALAAGTLDSQIAAVVAWAQALTKRGIRPVLEVWHEPDVKTRKGSGTHDQYAAAKQRFHDQVKASDSTLTTCATMSGWTFNPSSGIDAEPWALAGDLLGVDLDGMNSTNAYPDYSATIAAVAAFAAKHGYQGWAAPEVGEPRITADTDGSQRAAWVATLRRQIADAGAVYATAYDYAGDTLTSDAEIGAWKVAIG